MFFEKIAFFGSQIAQNGHKMAQKGVVVVGGGGGQRVNFGVLRLPDPPGMV